MKKIILVGNGMAGVKTIEELLKITDHKFAITVFGDEPYGNYNRILLSSVLAGDKNIDDIIINAPDWYQEHDISLHTDNPVTRIDRYNMRVFDRNQVPHEYDKLVIATGSTPFILPIEGTELEGVIGFRSIADVEKMVYSAKNNSKAVVIGGGLLGLEAAHGLIKQGMDVTVVHLTGQLLNMQLDSMASAMLRDSLLAKGMQFKLGANTRRLAGVDGKVSQVIFEDNSSLDADLVVMAVGISPNIELAKDAGIHCERGIIVNDTMQTFDPNIYAVGECVQHRGQTYGLVAPLFEQAKVCASHLAEYGAGIYPGSVTATKLKVTGVDLFSAGSFQDTGNSEDLVFQDKSRGVYKKLVIEDDAIKGCVLYGDTIDGSWYFQLMRDKTSIRDFRDKLLFGQAHIGDAGHAEISRIELMADDAEICGCNGVCKGDIVNAIVEHKLFSLEDVSKNTKAASSCGSCTGLVEQILASVLGGDYSQTPKQKSLCDCTRHTKQEVHDFVFNNNCRSVYEVFAKMEWDKPDGCHICRPEVNYYLIVANPDYVDDVHSRFVNERVHGNIQKNNTYSVVPRMWGGVTTPDELRAIADVADKYAVPTVKVTGGQRIDLFGISKEDLLLVWQDLTTAGMVSGHAYGKALRTVKTCAGSSWCRFGVRDSIAMGIKMEKMTWGSWMPHKFKMAVSGCPRNCAEATIKDLGVVAVQSGWEIHVGGNGGIKVRVTDLLCKVDNDDLLLEYVGAYIQLYRENAYYLERTAPWIERVGLSFVKQRLIDDADGRKSLHARFLASQQQAQNDPWRRLSTGRERAHEFTTINRD